MRPRIQPNHHMSESVQLGALTSKEKMKNPCRLVAASHMFRVLVSDQWHCRSTSKWNLPQCTSLKPIISPGSGRLIRNRPRSTVDRRPSQYRSEISGGTSSVCAHMGEPAVAMAETAAPTQAPAVRGGSQQTLELGQDSAATPVQTAAWGAECQGGSTKAALG